MKCPLIHAGTRAGWKGRRPVLGDCLENKCAWWDADKNCCAVLTAGRSLRFIHERLKDIRDRLPDIV